MKKIKTSILTLAAGLCAGGLLADDVVHPADAIGGDLPTLAVFPACTKPTLKSVMEKQDKGDELALMVESLDGQLAAAISKSGTFKLLSRGDPIMDTIIEEIGMGGIFGKQPIVPGAAYCVFIELDHFLDENKKVNPSGTRTYNKRTLQLSGQVKIVRSSDAVTFPISNLQVEEEDTTNDTMEMMRPLLARKFVAQSYEQIMDAVFPMLIIDNSGGVLTLDRGREFLSKDEKVEIYGPSKVVAHPRTGAKRQVKGELIGTATITSTEADYSQAKMDGSFKLPEFAEVRKPEKEQE